MSEFKLKTVVPAGDLAQVGTLSILYDGVLILDAPENGNPVKALAKNDAIPYFGKDINSGWYITDEKGASFITSDRSFVRLI